VLNLVRDGLLAVQGPGLFPGCSCTWIRGELRVACRSAQACGHVSAARYTSEPLACSAGSMEFVIPQGAPWASPLGLEGRSAASSVVPRMPLPFRQRSLESVFDLANVLCGLDRQG
jgi:hypothetical protein